MILVVTNHPFLRAGMSQPQHLVDL
jgi:hypothetical protein